MEKVITRRHRLRQDTRPTSKCEREYVHAMAIRIKNYSISKCVEAGHSTVSDITPPMKVYSCIQCVERNRNRNRNRNKVMALR